MPYGSDFFSSHHPGAASSARAIVPLILDLSGAKSVVDIGCGIGTWLAEFAARGVTDFHGYDGAWVKPDQLVIPRERFGAADLATSVPRERTFDLAISLEVAEHLPERSADRFVDDLVALAPLVVFSAAIPMQGGTDHINEQWPAYWAAKFVARGYVAIDCIRSLVWNDPAAEWWYAQNTILYASHGALAKSDALRTLAATHDEPLPLVHPRCFIARATQPVGLRRMIRDFPGAVASAMRAKGGGTSSP